MKTGWSIFSLLGWQEYVGGLSYPVAYDTWRELDQRNYENGRMRAANYRLTGKRLTRIPPSMDTYQATLRTTGIGAAYYSSKDEEGSVPYIQQARQHQQ